MLLDKFLSVTASEFNAISNLLTTNQVILTQNPLLRHQLPYNGHVPGFSVSVSYCTVRFVKLLILCNS